MAFRYPAGLITANSPVTANYPSGVWTNQQSAPYINGNVWTTDQYFENTTLLLHGDGTNGAQNNTFLDSSTNNFTITRNGNTTQGTFSPFSQTGWGNYFNGSSYYYFASNAAFNFDTYSTIEFWVNFSELSADQLLVGRQNQSWVSFNYSALGVTTSKIGFSITADNGSSWTTVSSSTTPTIGQWYHIAAVRDNTTLRLYINGTQEASTAFASTPSSPSNPFKIGGFDTSTLTSKCYLSNVRYVKGSTSGALPYSGNFTPPTTPLSAITGTQLLTAQSNRFVDNSSNAFAITVGGTPSVQAFSPFQPTIAWSPSVVGGSGYFDGSGDYLATPTSSQPTAAGDFTVSCWFYLTSFASSYYVPGGNWSAATSDEWLIQIQNNGAIRFLTSADGTFSSTGVVRLNEWMYFSATRSGSTVTVQVNGTTVRTYTKSDTLGSASKSINIGQQPGNSWPFNGYIADFRFVSGSAITAIPTAPATAISGTSLLLNFTNAGILDNASANDLETVGNAQISTSIVKYGTGSMAFDGTGDWLIIPYSQNFNFGTGDFTVECWANITYVQYTAIITSTNTSISTNNWLLGYSNTAYQMAFGIDSGGTAIVGADYTPYVNIWTHIAASRSGTTLRLFFNGVQVASATNSTSFTGDSANPVSIGKRYTNSTSYPINGYIDDLRITKGVARYTSNFTPPIARMPNQ